MKIRNVVLMIIVLALPMLLAACGGDKVGNAEMFLKAVADNDADEAEKYVCDDKKDELTGDSAGMPEGMEMKDISCEEDGDNVKCSYKISAEGNPEQSVSVTLVMDGDKVCDMKIE